MNDKANTVNRQAQHFTKPFSKLVSAQVSVKILAAVIALDIVATGMLSACAPTSNMGEQPPPEHSAVQEEASAQQEVLLEEPDEEKKPPFETQWSGTGLEEVVREQLVLGDGTIMSSDLEEITALTFVGPHTVVHESAELSYIHEIISEDIVIADTTKVTVSRYGDITHYKVSGEEVDIPESNALGTWNSFHLGGNQVSDLTPLVGHAGLKLLRLYNNQISDLTPISGLTGLEELNVGGNNISDLTPIAGMTELVDLRVYTN